MLWKSHEINLNLHHDGDGKFLKPNNPYTKLQSTGLPVMDYVGLHYKPPGLPVMDYVGLHYKPHQSKTSTCLNFKSN